MIVILELPSLEMARNDLALIDFGYSSWDPYARIHCPMALIFFSPLAITKDISDEKSRPDVE